MILRQWGGDKEVDGAFVHICDENFTLLPEAQPLLLFLTYHRDIDRWEVYDGGTGAFAIHDGKLAHFLTPDMPSYARYKGMELSEAVRQIRQQGR
jgi:hypothetical protein